MYSWLDRSIWMLLFFIAGFRMMRTQMEYFRLYRERHPERRDQLPTQEELRDRYIREPWRWPFEWWGIAWGMFRLLRERQEDPELEILRRDWQCRFQLVFAIMFLGLLP